MRAATAAEPATAPAIAVKRSAALVASELQQLQDHQLQRQRRTVLGFAAAGTASRPVLGGRPLHDFCSNDYLGLAREPLVVRAMQEAAAAWGAARAAMTAIVAALESAMRGRFSRDMYASSRNGVGARSSP